MSVFRSAIDDGEGMVDAGYLALFWTMAVTVTIIPPIGVVGVATALVALWKDSEQVGPILQATGIAIGAICTGAGVVIGAVGAFRMGDKPRAGTSSSVTTIRTDKPVGAVPDALVGAGLGTPAKPLNVDVVDKPKPPKAKAKVKRARR